MGLANSLLEPIANLGIELSILVWALTVWLGGRWGIGVGIIWIWHFIIRAGFGVGSPFPFGDATDDEQARRIYFAVYGLISLAFALLGAFFIWVGSFPDLLPFGILLKSRKEKREQNLPTMRHFGVALILALIIFIGGHLPHGIFVESSPDIALILVTVIPFVGYVAAALIFRYWIFDVAVWIPEIDKSQLKNMVKKRRRSIMNKGYNRVWITMGLIGFIHVILGNLILGLIIRFRMDVDWVWAAQVIIGVVILLIILIIWFLARGLLGTITGKIKKKRKRRLPAEEDEEFIPEDEEEEFPEEDDEEEENNRRISDRQLSTVISSNGTAKWLL
jgi:hypothetical protein